MKRKIWQVIYDAPYDREICVGDIRRINAHEVILNNDDIIEIEHYDIGEHDSDWKVRLVIEREREETDEEYNARLKEKRRIDETVSAVTKKQRYQEYLKLHEEFKDYKP